MAKSRKSVDGRAKRRYALTMDTKVGIRERGGAGLAVFLCGVAATVAELAACRVLAPLIGTSVMAWTMVLGVILAGLAAGYWLGGLLADRRPGLFPLSLVVLASAAACGLLALPRHFLFGLVRYAQASPSALYVLPLLFAPAAILLGMATPMAARAAITSPETSGREAGRIYALSTAGSIVGIFACGFALLPLLGGSTAMLAVGTLLALASLACHAGWKLAKAVVAALLAAALVHDFPKSGAHQTQGLFDTDTAYQRVLVYHTPEAGTGRPMRVLVTGPEGMQGGMYLDDPVALAVPYTRYFVLADHFRPDVKRLLVLGGGALSYPKYVLKHSPGLSLDVVELDPGITALARRFFRLPEDARLTLIHEDARVFLNANRQTYQAAILDVFNTQGAIPFHLATAEAAARIRDALDGNGVVLVNLVSAIDGPDARFYKAMYATYAKVFPEVRAYRVFTNTTPDTWQSVILAAFKNPVMAGREATDPAVRALLETALPPPDTTGAPVLTDEYAPAEYYLRGFGRK